MLSKIFNYLFPDYSNFGTTKLGTELIEADLDSVYRYLRASGYAPKEAMDESLKRMNSKIQGVGYRWKVNLSERIGI